MKILAVEDGENKKNKRKKKCFTKPKLKFTNYK